MCVCVCVVVVVGDIADTLRHGRTVSANVSDVHARFYNGTRFQSKQTHFLLEVDYIAVNVARSAAPKPCSVLFMAEPYRGRRVWPLRCARVWVWVWVWVSARGLYRRDDADAEELQDAECQPGTPHGGRRRFMRLRSFFRHRL